MVDHQSTTSRWSLPRGLWWVLAAGAVLRAGLWLACGNAAPTIHDAQHYDELASRLAETGNLVEADGSPACLRPPLYPAFVSVIFRAAGVGNYAAVYAVQGVLQLLLVVLVFYLGRLAYSERVGTTAAAIFCFHPTFVVYSEFLLTETLATLLLAGAFVATVRSLEAASPAWIAAAGLLYGLAALTRSATLLFVPVLALYLVWAYPATFGRRLAAAALLVATFAGTIGAWAVRNSLHQGTTVVIDVMGGRNAMMGNYEYTPLERSWATISDTHGEQAWDSVLRKARPAEFAAGPSQGQVDKLALSYALKFMRENPGLTAKRSAVKCFNFWQLEREVIAGASMGYFGDLPRPAVWAFAAVSCGYYAAVMFAALFGGWVVPPSASAVHRFFLLAIAVPWGAHTLIFAHSRYHLPLMPIVMVYAAAGLVHYRSVWASRKSWRFGLATLCCVVLVAAWFREIVAVDLGRL